MSRLHLDGLAEQVRRIEEQPLLVVRRSLPWDGWTAKHGVLLAVLAPLLYVVFASAEGNPLVGEWPWMLAHITLAGVGAVLWTTYLPTARPTPRAATAGRSAAGSPCATIAGLYVGIALLLINASPTLISAAIAVGIEIFAIVQRTNGTCVTGGTA